MRNTIENNLKLKPVVGVDARPLAYGMTGNSRYLIEVLKHLLRPDSSFQYRLYSHKPPDPVFHDILQNRKEFVRLVGNSYLPGFFFLNFLLPARLKKDDVNIFWGTLQLLPFRKLSIPSVVNYHDLNFISAPDTMEKWNYYQHRIFSPMTLANADMVFCLSENTKNEIESYQPQNKEKLKIVYPGISVMPSILWKKQEPFFFTIGTLEPRKNLRLLIEAYIEARKSYPSLFPLKIAGRLGWGEDELSNKLRSGEYEACGISFIQQPSEKLLSELFENCSCFLFPSIHEGFGLPLLEAQARQKICIASDIPVFREILIPGEDIFVPPQDKELWKSAMITFSKNPSFERPKYWNPAKWTWVETADKIESGFKEIWKTHLQGKIQSGY